MPIDMIAGFNHLFTHPNRAVAAVQIVAPPSTIGSTFSSPNIEEEGAEGLLFNFVGQLVLVETL